MSPWWALLLLLPLGLVLLPYLVGPLLVHATQRYAVAPRALLREEDPAAALPDPVAARRFVAAREALLAEGFLPLARLELRDHIPRLRVLLEVLADPALETGAMVGAWLAEVGGVERVAAQAVELATRFRDGGALSTRNLIDAGHFPRDPARVVHAFPAELPLARLVAAHRELLRRRVGGARPDLLPPGGLLERMARSIREEQGYAAERGYLVADGDDHWRPTWKGALLMTWAQCWPLGVWRRRSRERQAQALLRELGV